MLYLNMNIIVHPIFGYLWSVFLYSIWYTRIRAVFKVWDQESENVGSQQRFKVKDKFPMDSSKILRFSFSRCIVYKDGNLKLSKQLIFCKWDVVLFSKKPKQNFFKK